MLIPSIDLQSGSAVQLVGGDPDEKAVDAGDPRPIAERFGRIGEVAVIDLDAALGSGNNVEVIEELITRAPCRVGGGIRSVDTAVRCLDAGARKVILGTAAKPEILSQLPRERVIAALDARQGEVVVEGWTKETGQTIEARIAELKPHVGGFLVTSVEREGRMEGVDLDAVEQLVKVAGPDCRVTVAGGVKSPEEVASIDRLGADVQVGMALYTGEFDLADGVAACLTSDRHDGLWPTVITDPGGVALGLAYSNIQSLRHALDNGIGVYWSRKRGLWVKGETSGNTQRLLDVAVDCDRDTLRFRVEQTGSFCHLETRTCWGPDNGLTALEQVARSRRASAPEGSYTQRLFESPGLLGKKLREEAAELDEAAEREAVVWEAADVLYFTLVKLAAHDVSLAEVEAHLDGRALKVTRRE